MGTRASKTVAPRARYGAAWRRARDAALDRAGHQCARCGKRETLLVHHIDQQPELDDANRATNLEVLCRACHWLEHEQLGSRQRHRYPSTPRRYGAASR